IDGDHAPDAHELDGEPTQRRADEAGKVCAYRGERIGCNELIGMDETRYQRAEGRARETGETSFDSVDRVDDPEAIGRRDGEQWEERDGLDQGRRNEDPAPIPAVDEDAGDLTDEQRRDELDDENGRRRE